MLIGKLKFRKSLLVLFLASVKICTQDEQLCVIGVHFQTLLHLQSAFLYLPVYKVIFCFLIDLLYFRCDHGEEELNLTVIFINRIGIPKLFIAICVVKQTPEHHGSQNDQIRVFLVYHDAVVNLVEC